MDLTSFETLWYMCLILIAIFFEGALFGMWWKTRLEGQPRAPHRYLD